MKGSKTKLQNQINASFSSCWFQINKKNSGVGRKVFLGGGGREKEGGNAQM